LKRYRHVTPSARSHSTGPKHLDDESGGTLGDHIAVHEPGFAQAEHLATLRILTRVLTRRERLALRLRFEQDLTQQEIGTRLEISQMQVSRILRSSLQRLRHHAEQSPHQLSGNAA
jgi:RNA polymerase sigma-B factor